MNNAMHISITPATSTKPPALWKTPHTQASICCLLAGTRRSLPDRETVSSPKPPDSWTHWTNTHTHTPPYIKLLSAQPTVIVTLFYCMFVSALSCACIVLFLLQFLHTCSLCSPALIVCYMLHMTNAWREKLIWEIFWSARVEVGIRVV